MVSIGFTFMNRTKFLGFLLVLVAAPLPGREDPAVCGTHGLNHIEEIYLHRQSMARLQAAGRLRPLSFAAVPAARAEGNLVVLEDSDGVVARRNDFNLSDRTVTFRPTSAGRYRFETSAASYDANLAATGIPVEIDDDDTRQFPIPFSFPFYGTQYRTFWLNSDGNLSFTAGDSLSTSRSLGRLSSGPPRIAGLFRDLDPSRAPGNLRILAAPDRLTVSWNGVPEYSAFGTGRPQTFQIRLYPDGRIEFAYAQIRTQDIVVGIAPGRLQGATKVVSFTTGSTEEFAGAVAESFPGSEQLDVVRAAQRFYETFEDSYDYLFFFNNFNMPSREGAVAFEVTVRNNRTGYGDAPIEAGAEYGSRRRLQATINMGPLSQYPVNPNGIVDLRRSIGDTPLSILAHEAGHLFLAFASIRDPLSPNARPMLGFQSAHYGFNFNSEASLLEGNRIVDRGPSANPRFETTATVESYSPLDQYLMGFRAPEEVPPTFLVVNSTRSNNGQPLRGVLFNGERRDIRVQEIAEAEGRRSPDHTLAQRRFRAAFVLVTPAGTPPTAEQLQQVETYRREFETYYRRVSSERASMETNLARALQLSVAPAGGVLAGQAATAAVTLDRPAPEALTVRLGSAGGAVGLPDAVSIPAGQTRATFEIRGVRPGVDEVSARIDDRFESAVGKVQVLASPASLRAAAVTGDLQLATPGQPLAEPITLLVSDLNRAPYPGRRVTVTPSPGGEVSPPSAVSDENGLVRFTWTPGSSPLNELKAVVEASSEPALTLTALSRPAVLDPGAVNAASYFPGLTPGGFASVFGANLAAGFPATATLALGYPERLGGAQVTVNGTPVPLVYVSDRQINFLVPANLPLTGTEAEVVITTRLGSSVPVRYPLRAIHPGIFYDTATNYGAVLIANTGVSTVERPAAAGQFLEIYCTGLGPFRSAFPAPPETTTTPEVFLGDRPVRVLYSGGTTFPGLYQVNIEIPAGLPSGDVNLRIRSGGLDSNQVKVRLR
ncbi:MAG TPA: hypothetical protein DEH78_07105 [Solibacterales bacterium]|nr:hypothetical protein [Bryobacterales bacterium]